MKVFDNCSNKNNHNSTPDNNKKICSIDNSNIFFNSTCNIDKFDLSNKLWKQLSLNGDISIPDTKPLIKDIDSINTKVEIISQKVLKAPSIMKKRDFEGLRGGQRIIKIHGLFCFSVNYIALLKEEEMYIFQDKIPFSVAIDLPLKDSNQEDMINFEYVISSCIEDIHVNSIMDKTLNLTTTFILLANKSFSKDNLCIDENYFKDFNTNCKDSIPCLNCNEESQIVFKGIFSQDKIEDVSKDEDIKYFKRFESIEVLDLPKCNPNIIKILSITTNIKILCQRVVKTPILDENLENKQVTGFALFIHFILSQNIKYSSNTSCETIHYAIFNFPSSLYITLRDTTLISDKFKISYYIDDIYACILNERQIFINTSILFDAKLINCKSRPNNVLTFRGKEDNKIAIVEFYIDDGKLKIISTGDVSNADFSIKEYFSLQLDEISINKITSLNKKLKYKSVVHGNENADSFRKTLNNKDIKEGDIINLLCRERQKISISNYQGQEEYHPKYFSQNFKISSNGLEPNDPNILPNVITFKGEEDKDITIIRFNKDTLTLIVDSSGLISNQNFSQEVYFSFEIKDAFNVSKIKSQVMGNEDCDNFRNILNNQSFSYGDILTLEYKENNRVNITNYNENPNYNPSGMSEEYEITAEGLKPIKSTNITIKGALDKKIALISFNKDTSSLIVDSFGTIANPNFLNKYYFSFELTEPNGTQKYKSIINGNENANNFKIDLNGKTFNNNDIINLTYRERQRVSISNYQGQYEYNPQYFSESYKIIDNELSPNTIDILPNVITFKGNNDREITIIRFNKDKASLIVDSSGLEANLDFSTEVYLSLEITDAFNISKIKNEVMGNQDADDFKTALTDYEFVYGDILTLSYKENNKVIITNYEGTSNYNPSGISESYEITIEGLKPIKSINNNIIIIYGLFDAKFATINFDNNKFMVTSTGNQLVSNYEGMNVLKFTIKDKNFNNKKAMFIRGNDNATNLVNAVNDIDFEIGDILRFKAIVSISLSIDNYKGDDKYWVTWGSFDFNLRITSNGLRPANFNYLKNTIILYRRFGEPKTVFFINFEINSLKLFATSSGGRINNIVFSGREYFKLILKSSTGTTKLNLTQLGTPNAINFIDAIDEQSFSYGDILRLFCREPNSMAVTNFNDKSEYNQPFYSERYRISPNGLEPLSNTILENIITFKGDYYDRFTESTIIEVMCIIRFDVTEKILIVDSSGLKLKENPRYNEYFSVTLKKSSSTRPIRYSVSGNEDSDRFRNNFDTRSFEFGDVLTLTYVDNTNVEIAKFNGQDIYNPTGLESSYTITSSGLTLNP